MPRTASVFYNLVTDENSTTELLCNLMRFSKFRIEFLKLFISTESALKINWEDFDTQVTAPGYGRPDLQIHTDDLLALVEVKVRPGLGPSINQTNGYFEFLSNQDVPERYLIYLVPAAWVHLDGLTNVLKSKTDISSPPAIRTKIILWEEVVALIEHLGSKDRNDFLDEFCELLVARVAPKPVLFSGKEISMLFSGEFPQALSKLQRLVNDIQGQGTVFNVRPSGSRSLSPTEYGIYFRDSNGRPRFWFGVWTDFWKDHEKPICFGVDQGWGESVKRAFLNSYRGPTKQFEKYILGWVDQEILASENAAKQIWEQLSPVVEATIAAELPAR